MAQNADNDNSSKPANSIGQTTSDDWRSYNAGNTALAAAATVEPDSAPKGDRDTSEELGQPQDQDLDLDQSQDVDEPRGVSTAPDSDQLGPDAVNAPPSEPEVEQPAMQSLPALPEAGPTDAPATDPPPIDTQQFPFSVSDAASLSDLGVAVPQRPVPGDRSTQSLRTWVAPPRTDEPVTVSPSNAHLFNQPRIKPGTIDDVGVPSPGISKPVTAQPGFVVGLVAAAFVGAGLYVYLL